MVREHFVKLYSKEEDFLKDFWRQAAGVAHVLGDDWRPNDGANDATRHNQAYFLKTGALERLAFDSASVFHDDESNTFSSVQIVLVSSTRQVTVRVSGSGANIQAEKIIDRVPPR